MKKIYETPVATVITLAAIEKLAALDGHPDAGVSPANSDIPSVSHGTGSGRPK